MQTRRFLVFAAHPDDADICFGGTAVRLILAGHVVKFVSMTNGDCGHYEMSGTVLAERRLREAEASRAVAGLAEYEVCDIHDGQLELTVENRSRIVRIIRDFAPDVVLTHRTCDYHVDHRTTAQLVMDAAYLVRVPLFCPDTPIPDKSPIFAHMHDPFVDPRPFRPDAGNFRQKYNIPENAKVLLCISRIDYQKNQKILLELQKKYEDTHLLLIGPVTAEWYFEELLRDAEKLNVRERLTVIPGLKPDNIELLQALKTAYCFILPSRHEPFGIAALEALDAEVPLIASAVGGLRDFLVDGSNALLFEDNNADSLLEAYAVLETVREKIINGGKLTAEAYDWHRISLGLTALYRGLL